MSRPTDWKGSEELQRFARDAARAIGGDAGVTFEMLASEARHGPVARVRHFVAFFLREHAFARGVAQKIGVNRVTRLPFQAVAHILGGRDHTTAMASIEKIAGMLGDRRFEAERALVRRAALHLQSLGYGPGDLSVFFPGPPSFQRQAGVSEADAVPQTKRDRKREEVSSHRARPDGEGRQLQVDGEGRQLQVNGEGRQRGIRAGRSYDPAKRSDAGDHTEIDGRRA